MSVHHKSSPAESTPGGVPPLGYGFRLTGLPLPPLDEVLECLAVVDIPMNVTFRGVNRRQSALIRGPRGWGEFAPFLEYGDEEAAAWLACALEAAWLPAPEPVRESIPLNATLPAVPAERVPEVLARYDGTIRELKIKVAEKGQSLADDVARVAAAREALPEARLKIDANMGYTPSGALEALRKLCVIKAAPLGGVRRALAIVEQAQLPAVVSSALETSVGIATGAALAASLPTLKYGCGLGTVSLMAEDVAEDPMIAHDGLMRVRAVEPDPQRLERLAADEPTRRWWAERVSRCYRVLERIHRG